MASGVGGKGLMMWGLEDGGSLGAWGGGMIVGVREAEGLLKLDRGLVEKGTLGVGREHERYG